MQDSRPVLSSAHAGICIGAVVWPSKATWFSTILEIPVLFVVAPEVDRFFGIIMDPPPLDASGNFPGDAGQPRDAPAQVAGNAVAPARAEAEAPSGDRNAADDRPQSSSERQDTAPSANRDAAGDDDSD